MSETVEASKKIYQFLSNYGSDWKKEMDKNGDGVITKKEFRTFLGDSIKDWNGEELELNDSIINTFWNTFDTKTEGKIGRLDEYNALSTKEQAKLEERMNDYIAIDKYANSLSVPSGISDASRWKNSVKASLLDHLSEYTGTFNGQKETIEEFLARIGEIAQAKATADCYADTYFEQAINGVKDKISSDYKLKDDPAFAKIVDDYIANLDLSKVAGETIAEKLETIKNDIKALLDAYMQTAGLPDGDGDVNATELNDLQKAVVRKSIIDNLSGLRNSDEYKNFQVDFDEAVKAFVEENQGKTFGELKNLGASAFGNSKAKKTLDDVIYVRVNYENISDEFYKQLIEKYGEDLAEIIKGNHKYVDAYRNIIIEVLDKVKSGSLEVGEISDYILNVIDEHLLEFCGKDLSGLSLEQLERVYNAQMNAAIEKGNNATTDEEIEEALADQRNAALTYCDALASRGSVYADALNEIFGDDYKDVIKDLLPSQIQSIMTKVLTKAKEIGDIANLKATITSTVTGKTIIAGETNTSYGVNVSFDKDVESSRVTYGLVSQSGTGSVELDKNTGKLTIKGASAGYLKFKVAVMVDGIKVGTQEFSIEVKKQASVEDVLNSTQATEQLDLAKNVDNWNNNCNEDESFKTLYLGDCSIVLYGKRDEDDYNWGRYGKEVCRKGLNNLGASVIAVLKANGFDESKLKIALTKVVNAYITDTITISSPHNKTQSLVDSAISYGNAHREETKSRIIQSKDTGGANDSNCYVIHFKDFVDDLIREYNALV